MGAEAMHLPDPALTFTLPSLHDGIPLNCRIYHPLALALSITASAWRPKHAAVMAHPYAPLGGSYDDPIVEQTAGHLLRRGFVVATFNFRGATHSAGRTSWTARPEQDDYMSVAGFLVYYIHHLDRESRPQNTPPSVLLMGGYSYGAMVTTQLPPIASILAQFASPGITTTAAEIRTRAETLAIRERDLLQTHTGRRSLRIGEGGSPRKSREGRRSFSLDDAEEKLRKGVHDFIGKTRHRATSSSSNSNHNAGKRSSAAALADATLQPLADLSTPLPAYLLISPLQGIITNLATMSRVPGSAPAEAKLRQNPTLAVYGDRDVFVPVGKLRTWTTTMQGAVGSQFRGEEVDGAGHFWVEHGCFGRLMELIDDFGSRLISTERRESTREEEGFGFFW